jgi:hypothetical protein
MVRALSIGLLGALFVTALGCWIENYHGALASLVFSAALLVAFFAERRRYAGARAHPDATLRPTGERFIDPVSGELVGVYENDATPGIRIYQKEPPA